MTTIATDAFPQLPTLGCDPDGPSCRGQRAKVFVLAAEAGLTKGERHTVASIITDRTLDTFAGLTHREASRLIDALNGWHAITHLIDTARPWTEELAGHTSACQAGGPPGDFRRPATQDQVDHIRGLSMMVGLDRLDLFDLVLFVLGVEITGWEALYPSGAERVANALRGYLTVEDVLAARP